MSIAPVDPPAPTNLVDSSDPANPNDPPAPANPPAPADLADPADPIDPLAPPDTAGRPALRVRVHPYADLARFFPGQGRVRQIEAAPGATVGDLLDAHGLDQTQRLTLGVNGQLASRATRLRNGDTLEVLAPMAGGSR